MEDRTEGLETLRKLGVQYISIPHSDFDVICTGCVWVYLTFHRFYTNINHYENIIIPQCSVNTEMFAYQPHKISSVQNNTSGRQVGKKQVFSYKIILTSINQMKLIFLRWIFKFLSQSLNAIRWKYGDIALRRDFLRK